MWQWGLEEWSPSMISFVILGWEGTSWAAQYPVIVAQQIMNKKFTGLYHNSGIEKKKGEKDMCHICPNPITFAQKVASKTIVESQVISMSDTCWNQMTNNSVVTFGTFCKLRTFKNIFTAPWPKNWIGCSFLLSKYHITILQDKKRSISFYFTFCERDILHVSLWGTT